MRVEQLLGKVPMFAGLPAEILRGLATAGSVRTFTSGAIVCREGERAECMYVILGGRVRIYKTGQDGHEVDVVTLQPGACFGELAMLDRHPRSASGITDGACALLVLDRDPFIDLLLSTQSHALMSSVLSVLVGKVRSTTEKLFDKELARRTLHIEMEAARHRSVAEMVAGVAHELNTPLGVARSAASIIRSRADDDALGDVPSEAAEVVEDMLDAAELLERNIARAYKLIEQFKHVSVIQVADQLETVDLSQLVVEILDLFRINADHRRLAIEIDDELAPEHRSWQGHPAYVTQVLTNLLFNADRHAYPDGTGGRIVVRLRRDAAGYELSVEDFGRGIPEQDLGQIFTPFFTTARGRGGSGLGLAIVHNLVTEGMGGTIGVDSEPGRGTKVTVRLPAGE